MKVIHYLGTGVVLKHERGVMSVPEEKLCVVLVCDQGGCSESGLLTLAALRPMVQRSTSGVLVRSECLANKAGCQLGAECSEIHLQECAGESMVASGPRLRVAEGDVKSRVATIGFWLSRVKTSDDVPHA